jgi:hypothetical protein
MGGDGGGQMGGMGGSPSVECAVDSDCAGNPNGSVCDVANGVCVTCLVDTQCPIGSICKNQACVPGCSSEQPCANGLSCCDNTCRDLLEDNDHCGACALACASTVTADRACVAGSCAITSCKPYFYDCNANPQDGCEEADDGNPCVCVPGAVESCYTGAPGTEGIGPCAAGSRTCAMSGLKWSECQNQVLPQWEICGNQVDDDCNGLADDDLDLDGDGWTRCNGDCGEHGTPGLLGVLPHLINPGAMEIILNGVDDDCDPATVDMAQWPTCSATEKLAEVLPEDLVKALDLCQFTQENLPLPQRNWGVIEAQFLLADGSVPSSAELNDIRNSRAAVLEYYGGFNDPHRGATMAGLSTGMMRDTVHHGYAGSTSFSSVVNPPANYLAETGGILPHPATCEAATMAHDSVNLRFRVRVPTNTDAFLYDALFGTAESMQVVCAPGDDFALGFLSPRPAQWPAALPMNLLDWNGQATSVNSLFFATCSPAAMQTCPLGPAGLSGTPMQRMTEFSTSWVTVVPGQIITLDFQIFDADNSMVDSVLLLDAFSFRRYSNSSCWPLRADMPQDAVGGQLHCHPYP